MAEIFRWLPLTVRKDFTSGGPGGPLGGVLLVNDTVNPVPAGRILLIRDLQIYYDATTGPVIQYFIVHGVAGAEDRINRIVQTGGTAFKESDRHILVQPEEQFGIDILSWTGPPTQAIILKGWCVERDGQPA